MRRPTVLHSNILLSEVTGRDLTIEGLVQPQFSADGGAVNNFNSFLKIRMNTSSPIPVGNDFHSPPACRGGVSGVWSEPEAIHWGV